MGQKQIKRTRRILRNIQAVFGPIMPEVLEYLDYDEELFMRWATAAMLLYEAMPETTLDELHPSNLDETIKKFGCMIEKLDSVEYID